MDEGNLRKRVAARIQRARWRLGWTQADAAEHSGVVVRYFREVERGIRNPTLGTLFAIAKALRVRLVDLVDVEAGERVDLDALELTPPKTGRKRHE